MFGSSDFYSIGKMNDEWVLFCAAPSGLKDLFPRQLGIALDEEGCHAPGHAPFLEQPVSSNWWIRGLKTLLPQVGITLQGLRSFSPPWGSAEAFTVTALRPDFCLFLFCSLPSPPCQVSSPAALPSKLSAHQSPSQHLLLGEPDL